MATPFNTAKFEEAMTHLKEAEDFSRRAGFDADQASQTFFGDIYDQLGNTAEAENITNSASKQHPRHQTTHSHA